MLSETWLTHANGTADADDGEADEVHTLSAETDIDMEVMCSGVAATEASLDVPLLILFASAADEESELSFKERDEEADADTSDSERSEKAMRQNIPPDVILLKTSSKSIHHLGN